MHERKHGNRYTQELAKGADTADVIGLTIWSGIIANGIK